MATIWDADVLIWAASVLMEMQNRGLNEIPRTLQFRPFDLLRRIGRKTGGAEYHWLRGALARLQATVVRTNIRAKGRRKEAQFGWIENWTDLTDEVTGESLGMAITVSEWFYEGVLMKGGSLAVDPAYFDLTGGRERWLYRVARKHAGDHGAEGWAISIPTLFKKSGAEGSHRRFKLELRRLAERNALPEFHLAWEEPQLRSKEPMLRMTRRSKLDIIHAAYQIPRPRPRGGPPPAPRKRS
jgi:plasmid replication initiation protein